MEQAIAKVLATFLEHGIVGAVAALALWYAWQERRRANEMAEQNATLMREHAKAKLQIQKDFYERLIESTAAQNQKYEGVVAEMKETVRMLAENVAYESEDLDGS